ncbi:hypothetical protein [Burkholderia sp. BCC0405]|uniref:hypothetical protein n=1 Tax=Burkholderia sp. BCC0405 TaxID=2676298 RepID=UPI001FC8C7C1|nr:hypothetical protein [Burkholderia sp. BCC0405]
MPVQAQRRALDLLVCRLEASALSAGRDVAPLYRDDMFVVCGPRHPLPRRARILARTTERERGRGAATT